MAFASRLSLSHLELRVADLRGMERFYVDVLGFVVTDRGKGEDGMVFLSMSQGEHHQIVLGKAPRAAAPSVLDHIALRAPSLEVLRHFRQVLQAHPQAEPQTVSHGTSWSLYLKDPEDNRMEIFVDTPWHVDQPVRFPVDLSLADAELIAFTEARIRQLPGFKRREQWLAGHMARMPNPA
jgi:catechol 2,3-dioxygenase